MQTFVVPIDCRLVRLGLLFKPFDLDTFLRQLCLDLLINVIMHGETSLRLLSMHGNTRLDLLILCGKNKKYVNEIFASYCNRLSTEGPGR